MLPWTLACGDVDANIQALKAGPQPTEVTTLKFWRLLNAGTSHLEVRDAVMMLREVRWSTSVVEQLHGTCAIIHKLHHELGQSTLVARTMVTCMRPLLAASDPLAQHEAKHEAAIARLEQLHPDQVSGRQHFIGEFMRTAKRVAGKNVTFRSCSTWMREAARQWAGLAPETRGTYDREASRRAAEKRQEVEAKKEERFAEMSQRRQQMAETAELKGTLNQKSACRFSEAATTA